MHIPLAGWVSCLHRSSITRLAASPCSSLAGRHCFTLMARDDAEPIAFASCLQLRIQEPRMKYFAARLFTLHVALTSVAASSVVAAEVYKWVDKDGKVHYSERKPPQAVEKVVDIRISSSPPSTVRPAATAASSSQEASGPAEPVKRKEDSGQGSSRSRPRSLSGGKIDETKESKCNLARDVLSGAVKHGNGAPTDAHDRQVAENDIRLFCK